MWFWYSLAAAVLAAIESIINKKALNKIDAVVFTWSLFALSLPLFAYLGLRDGLPSVNQFFVIGTTGSAIAFALSKSITSHAIRQGVLSKLIPLTTFNVLFTYLLGLIFLQESIKLTTLLGLLLLIFGAYILNAEGNREDIIKPFKVLFSTKASMLYLFALFISSVAGIFDKTAMNNMTPINVSLILFIEQLIMTVLLTIYLFKSRPKWVVEIKQNFWPLFWNSLLYAIISLLAFQAIADAPVALAQGVKRVSILFTLFLGILFLQDHPTKHTWIATLIMITGVILIKASI